MHKRKKKRYSKREKNNNKKGNVAGHSRARWKFSAKNSRGEENLVNTPKLLPLAKCMYTWASIYAVSQQHGESNYFLSVYRQRWIIFSEDILRFCNNMVELMCGSSNYSLLKCFVMAWIKIRLRIQILSGLINDNN